MAKKKIVVIDALGHHLEQQSDGEYHWMVCTNPDCDYIEGEKEAHNFVTSEDGTKEVCSVCGHSHTLVYRLEITHEDKFVVGQSVDFTHTETWNDDAKAKIEGIKYKIGTSGPTCSTYGENYPIDSSNVGKNVYVHIYISMLEGSEITVDNASEKLKIIYNGIEMMQNSYMTLNSKKCSHYEITLAQWGENVPVVTEN